MPPLGHDLHGINSPLILTDELIREILSWLPVKSLTRFKCVCKSWNSLHSDPQFVKLHLSRSSTRNFNFSHLRLLFLCEISNEGNTHASSLSVGTFLENPSAIVDKSHLLCRLKKKYWVIGSCNGLICLLGFHYCFDLQKQCCWVRFWNPATRSRSEKSTFLYPEEFTTLNECTGFGYDHLSGIYKVVVGISFPKDKVGSKNLVKVFNMGDNCWRTIECFPTFFPMPPNDIGVYLSGTLNWVTFRKIEGNVYPDLDSFIIVSLDLGKEKYAQLSLPPSEIKYPGPTIGVLRDCLCLSHDYNKTHFLVWEMKEFGFELSWTPLLTISYQHFQTLRLEFTSMNIISTPLCMSKNGDTLMLQRRILHYQRNKRLEVLEIPNNIYRYMATTYVESLISPC